MTSKQAALGFLLLCAVVGLSSCARKPPAETVAKLSQAELAVREADKGRAPAYARLELFTAKEQLASAQQAMQKKDYAEARRLADRALVNAQLAEAIADATEIRQAAVELRQSIEALRREAERLAARSQ